jgi:hypothetical protein
MCKVVSVVSGTSGRGTTGGNRLRLSIAQQVMCWARDEGAHLVIFPAGFLRAAISQESDLVATVRPLTARARSLRLSVVVGVDCSSFARKDPQKASKVSNAFVRRGRLPFFGIGWTPGMRTPKVWRQRSTTSWNCSFTSVPWELSQRQLVIDADRVVVVLCGEAFDPRIRADIVAKAPALVVIPAHTAAGSRLHNALEYFSENGVAAVRAVHAKNYADCSMRVHGGSYPPLAEASWTRDSLWVEAGLFDTTFVVGNVASWERDWGPGGRRKDQVAVQR